MSVCSVFQFRDLITKEMDRNQANNYTDNWDNSLFGNFKEPLTWQGLLKPVLAALVPRRVYNNLLFKKYLGRYADGLTYLYNQVQDNASRELLIKILVYRMMGHKKVKLPLSNSAYWDGLKEINNLIVPNTETISIPFMNMKLSQFELRAIGYPISLFFVSVGIMIDYITRQYEYGDGNVVIKAEENDIVIDAGGCWGDTALFFANAVGDNGKVYTFEFVPGNIEIFKRNLDLNPPLKERIELVERPVWNQSGLDVFYTNKGPGSYVSMKEFKDYYGKSQTLSIDDMVEGKNLPTVDFIKMDIEGAEPYAIEGAKDTLLKYKPKLAVSIYHDLEHFSSILKYIQSLDLGYKFYLKHATIHSQETVLFAQAS